MANAPADPNDAHAEAAATAKRLMRLARTGALATLEGGEPLTTLIGELCAERGATVVMVEHHMDVVLALADRLAVMHHGALLACDTPAAVMADATVQSAYVGEAL